MVERYLDDLERRIDPDTEERLFGQWRAFADGAFTGDIFSPRRAQSAPPAIEWPHVLVNEALGGFAAMALQQLEGCSKALAEGNGALLSVRCNYGTAILPSLFGAELFLMDSELDTLPTCRPLGGGAEAAKRLLDQGVPDINAGQGEMVLRMGHYYKGLLKGYPKLSKCIYVYHPDLQGPMNVCEMLWGGSLYVDLYDQPALIKDFLSLITETYINFTRRWNEIIAPLDGYGAHWSMLHRGRIMLRDDAATNLSPAMFDEFVRSYDQRLLDELGGGGIHFCGRGDHFISHVGEMSGVHAVNMTQPALNDLETVFQSTIDRKINLIGLERMAAEESLRRGRSLNGRVHCW